MAKGSVRIGTSGWSYDHWMGRFYPEKLKSGDLLPWYAERFDAVEINGSFYRLPTRDIFAAWRNATPRDFRFAVKASRFVTHMKKLKEPEQIMDRSLTAFTGLGDKLGPILFQLPPSWRINIDRLESLLAARPKELRYVFEFRHDSWFADEVYTALRRHGAGFCIHELAGRLSPLMATSDVVYVRLHGPQQTAYTGSYRADTLRKWAERIEAWRSSGHDVWFFFDNDQNAHAPKNALKLKEFLSAN